jgi:micrococcal nuclease
MPRYFRISPIFLISLIALIVVSIIFNIILVRKLYSGKIVSTVYDGDSFVLVDGTRVRLMGVDAPEKGRCGYQEAKEYLTKLIGNRQVRLKNSIVDDYGRLVANVTVFFTNVNKHMVAAGLAKNTNGFMNEATDAKARGLGIYGTRCRSLAPPSKCAIKGNIQQEGKLFYPPDCKAYGNVIVDLSYGDEWFCTQSDAVIKGFVLSPSCQ